MSSVMRAEEYSILSIDELFAPIPPESRNFLERFDLVIQDIQPLTNKQLFLLPKNIKNLSHQLTDERSNLNFGYMNDNVHLSSYIRYFMWWNLVRFTYLFAGLPHSAFDFLHDESYCLDVGSGPLTIPLALYLARPELRTKKLTWYCLDTSQNALRIGEEIFLSSVGRINHLYAELKTTSSLPKNITPWHIIRVKGQLGAPLHNEVSFVTCANMFNEIYTKNTTALEKDADKYGRIIFEYADAKNPTALFIAEPGIPRAGRFIALLRNFFISQSYSVLAPCPHEKSCPLDGIKSIKRTSCAKNYKKWCHFVLRADNAPLRLKTLSRRAGLEKDRASLSFVFVRKNTGVPQNAELHAQNGKGACTKKNIRIVSDSILVPKLGKGNYACSDEGLLLVIQKTTKVLPFVSGDLITLNRVISLKDTKGKPVYDLKTGAKIIIATSLEQAKNRLKHQKFAKIR